MMISKSNKPKVVRVSRTLSPVVPLVQPNMMNETHSRVSEAFVSTASSSIKDFESVHKYSQQSEISRSTVQIQRINLSKNFQETILTPTTDRIANNQQSISPINFEEISITPNSERSLISSASRHSVNEPKKDRFATCFGDVTISRRHKDKINDKDKHRRRAGGHICTRCCCYCLMASILAAILLATLIATIVMMALQSKSSTSKTTTTVTTATTATTTTTSSTTSTSTSTSTSSTSSTTSSSTSSTSSSSTTSSSTTSSTTSSTSSTTSTTTTRTTTTTTTSTTTTTTTTTTAYDSCLHLRWNQTGEVVAGSSAGAAATQFNKPAFIYIDVNDIMYVCDHHNDRVQQWQRNAAAGVPVANAADGAIHPEGIIFDKNGYMYVTGHQEHNVIKVSPGFTTSINVAGIAGTSGSALHLLNKPLGLAVDDDLNLYIAERDGERIVKWAPNATNGSIVVNPAVSGTKFYGLLLSLYSSNQVYVSSEDKDAVYLWTFNSTTPTLTLTAVNHTNNLLVNPRGIKYDSYGNLYVADKGNKRVVMYCNNATVGRVVIDTGSNPALNTPLDIAFDSDFNLYVSDEGLHKVVRYNLL